MASAFKQLQKRNNSARVADFNRDNDATGGKLEEYLSKQDKNLMTKIKKGQQEIKDDESSQSENDADIEK